MLIYLKSFLKLFLLSSILTSASLYAEEPTSKDAASATFCSRNPDARICKSALDVRTEEKEELEEYCRYRPNTEKCKNKKVVEDVRNERKEFCSKNPKACAARR